MKDKKWKVLYKKLPNQTVIDTLMPVISPTKDKAVNLALFGISLSNGNNSDVKDIEIVSCKEIV